MINNFLNKEALISLAFASWTSGGSCPEKIIGKITDADDEFVCISYDPTLKGNKIYFKNTSGKMLVRKDYLISVTLL